MIRQNRKELIEFDDGSLDDVVYRTSSTGQGTYKTYHGDRGCRFLDRAESVFEMERGRAQKALYVPCKECTIDMNKTGLVD